MRVVLYGGTSCPLCDLAEGRLRALRSRRPFDFVKVDVAGDPALLARFRDTIPVVEVNGRIVSEGRFDERAVARAVGCDGPIARLLRRLRGDGAAG